MNTRAIRWCVCLAAVAAAAVPVAAQEPAAPPPPAVGPPIQRIETASALSTEQLGAITSVRELADGRVLVNDGTRRRLLLMDTTLTTVRVVLDSLSEIANTYGTRVGALLPWRGDSTLFVDPASYAMVVLDPDGNAARIRSVWSVQHVMYYTSSSGLYGLPGLDARGRMVHRIPAIAAPPAVPPPAGIPYFPNPPDSAFIVAVNLDTRRADTLAAIRIPKVTMNVRQSAEGFFSIESMINPLPTTDDWAVLPDGTVAIVRGLDYRIDYLDPDGTWSSSEKLPYEWQRLLDEDKTRLVDSVRVAQQRFAATSHASATIRWVNMYGQRYPPGFAVPEGFVLPPGMPRDWILPDGVQFPENYNFACPPGVDPPAPAAGAPVMVSAPGGAGTAPPCMPAPVTVSGGIAPPLPALRTVHVVPAAELPDYRPPFTTNAVRADMDGNLWIRTVQPRPVPGGLVYDVVNRDGELVQRLQLPPGYTLVGFGHGRVVYLSMRDPTGIRLARVRLR